jgi:hypothetical protein
MTTAVSSNPVNQPSPQMEAYFHQRSADLRQLGEALKSGDLTGAQQAYNAIVTLGQSGPFKGEPFAIAGREQDFQAIGQALQSGDLAGAQKSFSALETLLHSRRPVPPMTGGASSSSVGPDVVVSLSSTADNTPSTTGV